MREVARGGKSWFVMESKLFELLVEDVGGKLKGYIWERCKGVSSWTRFGEASLWCLLDGVEACCREIDNRRWVLDWEEGVGSIGWSAIQTRQEGLFCALSEILRQKNSASFFQKGRGCPVDGILWRRSWEALEWSLLEA